MSLNQNGLYSASWTTVQNHHQVSEGAIVGISFGWIIGAIGFYILGVFIICKCIPKRKEDDSDSQDDKKSSEQKRSKQSSQRKRKSSETSESGVAKDIRRKRLPEHNPTTLQLTQMDKPSEMNTITFKLKDGREVG